MRRHMKSVIADSADRSGGVFTACRSGFVLRNY
nr:MAG TPA: hypothetical protein [Caudoviricetes sp.]